MQIKYTSQQILEQPDQVLSIWEKVQAELDPPANHCHWRCHKLKQLLHHNGEKYEPPPVRVILGIHRRVDKPPPLQVTGKQDVNQIKESHIVGIQQHVFARETLVTRSHERILEYFLVVEFPMSIFCDLNSIFSTIYSTYVLVTKLLISYGGCYNTSERTW